MNVNALIWALLAIMLALAINANWFPVSTLLA
jgi:hypothetical protein